MHDINGNDFVIRRKECTHIVVQNQVGGITCIDTCRQVVMLGKPSLPVLASDQNRWRLPLPGTPQFDGRPEPLRDPRMRQS